MKCVSALSTLKDTGAAFSDVSDRVAGGLSGEPADVALIFSSPHHAQALGRFGRDLRRRGLARHVIGCTGESIIGEDQEVEGTPALSLWSARLPGVDLTPRRLTID